MRPSFLDNMSWAMAEVYGAVTDRILINLAKYFPYVKPGEELPGSFEYQARMLAQMGRVNRETADIIMKSLDGADAALRGALEAAILDALKNEEPKLRKAAEQGLLHGAGFLPPEVDAGQMQAFQSFYRQSADKLNLVNTVMLESTEQAYRATVADVTARINRTQSIMNAAAGEVVTGVSSWNTAMHDAVQKMVDNGLTGFVDHGGHRWSPEAYVAMDVRTTMFNTARAAVWERAESYGADLYQVSSHNGARPLCYPWQGKVISRSDWTGEVEDLDGNKVHVYAQSETSMNEPAGLFQINCKHYPMTFIPGFSTLKGEPQDPEENEQAYEESQQQRALERKLREEKRDLEVMKAQGADPEAIKAQRQKVAKASSDIDDFCEETGRARRRNREYTPVNAKFPPKDSYNPAEFPTEQRDRMQEYYGGVEKAKTSDIINPGDDMSKEAEIDKYSAERRTYGKTTGMFYDATAGDEVGLYEEVWLQNEGTGKSEKVIQKTGAVTVPTNDTNNAPLIYQLPSGEKSFMAFDATRNTILADGRVAIDKHTGRSDTRIRVQEMLENEIDTLGGIRKDGVFYRVTSNPKDAEYIKAGKIRPSKNHMTGSYEDGLSVWERPKYYDKYMERLSGEVIGIGSDGEPLLDVKTVKLLEPINITEAQKKGRKKFLELYGWTEEQLDKALRGDYKVTR